MAYRSRGKNINYDNIAVGSATGKERTISGGGGENTTNYGGAVENFMSPCGSSFTSPRDKEKLWRTVSGNLTTDVTTDLDPKF